MTDTATNRYKARQQSQGSNTNTWGDDKLNEVLRLLDRGSKGYESIAMTGDTTLSWSNYVATNSGQVAILKLTGSLSSAASLTVPSAEWNWDLIWNTTGQTVTVKTSAGTGVAIPNGRQVQVFCDGTDCYFATSNYLGLGITETNNLDLMDKLAVETAIATASLPATAGTVLVSATDTTAGYLGAKVAVAGDIALTTQNPGANESALFTHTPYWNTPRSLTSASSPITALNRDVLRLNTSGGAITVNLPASGRVWVYDASGNAVSNNVTLVPAGADTITFNIIDSAYFGAQWIRTGTVWDLA
jgi:hypothetical protein